MLTQLNTRYVTSPLPPNMEEMFRSFAQKAQTLSSAERRILDYYIDGHEVADIPELAFISIHTVKKHNHSIYQKLGVASRDELMLYIELFRCCDRLDELTAGAAEAE
jgi:DNA-binding NarL/FixJ family response regulator